MNWAGAELPSAQYARLEFCHYSLSFSGNVGFNSSHSAETKFRKLRINQLSTEGFELEAF